MHDEFFKFGDILNLTLVLQGNCREFGKHFEFSGKETEYGIHVCIFTHQINNTFKREQEGNKDFLKLNYLFLYFKR